jgi:hypothetical protein
MGMPWREVSYAKSKNKARGRKALQENRVRKNHEEQSLRQPHSDQENNQEKKKHQEIRSRQVSERKER